MITLILKTLKSTEFTTRPKKNKVGIGNINREEHSGKAELDGKNKFGSNKIGGNKVGNNEIEKNYQKTSKSKKSSKSKKR